MLEREHPWNIRRLTSHHYRWFRDLADLHAMALGWIAAIGDAGLEVGSETLARSLSPAARESLWMLPSLPRGALDAILDDSLPEDCLGRLERTVWAIQARVAEAARQQGISLEQPSRNAGHEIARRRWPELPEDVRADPRGVFSALGDSPFAFGHGSEAFLVRRLTASEASIELRRCPHQLDSAQNPEAHAAADLLCSAHAQALRGFVQGISPALGVQHEARRPRCIQRWSFGAS